MALIMNLCLGLNDISIAEITEINHDKTELYGMGKKHTNEIAWQRQSTIYQYSVQKSIDGITDWQEIGEIVPKEVKSKCKLLSITDENPTINGFYRVVVIENNQIIYTYDKIQINRNVEELTSLYSA